VRVCVERVEVGYRMYLIGELSNAGALVLSGTAGGERRKADDEEVEARERDEVDRHLAQIRVELTREAEAAGHTRHHLRHLSTVACDQQRQPRIARRRRACSPDD
jgi:hypothetical protein